MESVESVIDELIASHDMKKMINPEEINKLIIPYYDRIKDQGISIYQFRVLVLMRGADSAMNQMELIFKELQSIKQLENRRAISAINFIGTLAMLSVTIIGPIVWIWCDGALALKVMLTGLVVLIFALHVSRALKSKYNNPNE